MPETEVRDVEGRLIILSDRRWAHIVDGHPELSEHRSLIMAVLIDPVRIIPGRRRNESWHYGAGGPSRFVKVVVDWLDDQGIVITAFARHRIP